MRMRTTINLDDGAFRAETRAAQNGTTLAREVKDVLRADLHRDDAPEPVEPFAFPAVRGDCCPVPAATASVAMVARSRRPSRAPRG